MTQTDKQLKKEEKRDDIPSATPAAAPSSKNKNYIAEGFRNKTKGEGVFNFVTYFGVGYLGVTAASIFLTWLLRDTNTSIARGYNHGVESFVQGVKKAMPNAKWLHGVVESNSTIFTLFLGGTLFTVFPVKWLEDAKPNLVKWFDEIIYGKEKAKTDPALVKAHEEIESAPKQTWKSVVFSRFGAFVTTYGTSFLVGPANSPVGRLTDHSIDSVSIAAGRRLDRIQHVRNYDTLKSIDAVVADHPDNRLSVIRQGNLNARGTPNGLTDRTASRVWSYTVLDGIYTALTSTALFISTRWLGPLFDKRDDKGNPINQQKHATSAKITVDHTEAAANENHPSAVKNAASSKEDASLASANENDRPAFTVREASSHQKMILPERAAAM